MGRRVIIELLDRLDIQFDRPDLTEDAVAQLRANVRTGWQLRGACHSVDDDAWFPDLTRPDRRSASVARCARCPVRRSCLAFALAEGEEHGIWGGTTDVQRHALMLDLGAGVSVHDVLESATVRPAYLWSNSA